MEPLFRAWMVGMCVGLLLASSVQSAQAQRTGRVGLEGWRTDWERTTIDLDELEVNIPRDAIPSIDAPKFVAVDEARRWVGEKEPVVVLVHAGVARAYPLQILTWHEIVNDDRSFGFPVAVTFCPLCYSALAFDRRVDGRVLTFGVSGMLRHSDLVMFDRETHTLWQQLTGEGIVGTYAGTTLRRLPAQIISFAQFAEAYPDGRVLSRETGHHRQYGRNPYVGYDDIDARPFLYRGPYDDRLPPMEKVVAVDIAGERRAYPYTITRKRHVIHDELGGRPLVVFHTERGATSALAEARIADAREVGSTGVFDPTVDGQVLRFTYRDGRFIDEQTGTVWDITGRAREGPLAGRRLEPIPHGDYFAFAFLAFRPDAGVYRE